MNWILYEPIWKWCRFRPNINEPLPHSVEPGSIVVVLTGHMGHSSSPVKFLCVPISHNEHTPSCLQAPILQTEMIFLGITIFFEYLPRYHQQMASIVSLIVVGLVNRKLSDGSVN